MLKSVQKYLRQNPKPYRNQPINSFKSQYIQLKLVYIYIYAYIHTNIHIHTYIYIHTYIHIYTYTLIHIHTIF